MKKNVIKRMVLAFVLLAAICSTTSTALAVGTNYIESPTEMVSPRYTGLKSFFVDISIKEGKAFCSVSASASPSYTVRVSFGLQQNNGGWCTLKNWSSEEGILVSTEKNCFVTSGSAYRVYGTVQVYDSKGNCVETETTYSKVILY